MGTISAGPARVPDLFRPGEEPTPYQIGNGGAGRQDGKTAGKRGSGEVLGMSLEQRIKQIEAGTKVNEDDRQGGIRQAFHDLLPRMLRRSKDDRGHIS